MPFNRQNFYGKDFFLYCVYIADIRLFANLLFRNFQQIGIPIRMPSKP